MIYRDKLTMYYPILDDKGQTVGYQRETLESINAAKAKSRKMQLAGQQVRCGRPPKEQANVN